MTVRIFLDEEHWAWLLKSVFEEMQVHPSPASAPLGQLWRLLVQANKHKRFSIEVENADLLSTLGESDNGQSIETFIGPRRPRSMARDRDAGPP